MPRQPAAQAVGRQGVRSDPESEGFEEKYRAAIEWGRYAGASHSRADFLQSDVRGICRGLRRAEPGEIHSSRDRRLDKAQIRLPLPRPRAASRAGLLTVNKSKKHSLRRGARFILPSKMTSLCR
jgi:hypothetical protein